MKLEMRTLKNIAAAAMTLAVVFGAASLKPVTANAAEASGSASIEEENSYISFQDEAYQNEFLRRVNNERAKAGLKPVQLGDSSHNSAAQERAKELASSYSYVRPNGLFLRSSQWPARFYHLRREWYQRCVRWRKLHSWRFYPRCSGGSVDEH